MRRAPRRLFIDFETLLAAHAQLAAFDATWRKAGYERTSARLWRCRDHSYTARVVWRQRGEIVSTITFTARGIPLAGGGAPV